MSDKCGILICSRPEIVCHSDEMGECLRPCAHGGPHLIYVAQYKRYRIWECDCEDCRSENSDDWCLVYGDVSEAEAKKLLESADYEGK